MYIAHRIIKSPKPQRGDMYIVNLVISNCLGSVDISSQLDNQGVYRRSILRRGWVSQPVVRTSAPISDVGRRARQPRPYDCR